MLNQLHCSLQKRRIELYALTLFVVMTLFMIEPLNMYLAWSLLYGYGLYLFLILGCFYLYFRGFRDGWEITVAILFVFWLIISRVINGDVVLQMDGWNVLKGPLMVCMLSLGPLLTRVQRRRALYGFGILAGIYYTVLGLISLYSFVTRKTLLYKLTEVTIGIAYGFRLEIMGGNPNVIAFWFLMCFAYLLYIFLDCRHKLWRIPLAFMMLVQYCLIAATYCRSAELAFCGCAGLLTALLLEKRLRGIKVKAGKIVLLALAAVLAGVLCFKGFGLSNGLMGAIHDHLPASAVAVETNSTKKKTEKETAKETEKETSKDAAKGTAGELTRKTAEAVVLSSEKEEKAAQASAASKEKAKSIFQDPRSLTDDSQRFLIYKTLPEVFRQDPMRLLRGCLYQDRMTITNALLHKEKPHMHNTWLEILNYTGIPGLLLLLVFTVLVIGDCVELYFSRYEKHTIPIKCMTLPVMAGFCYSMFESIIWVRTDIRTLGLYLFMGFVIAEVRESRTQRSPEPVG